MSTEKSATVNANISKERWSALMSAFHLEPSVDCFESLCAAYSEKHRHYHTLSHVHALLEHFDTSIELSERPEELELAIWFHDAIYKIRSHTNELDSALWAKNFLSSSGVCPESIDRVFSLILATEHGGEAKKGKGKARDEKLMLDIDLSILGASIKEYDEFERRIRREYQFVPGIVFRKKRKAILKSFLDRNSIYYMSHFREKFEEKARANITRAIAAM